MNIYPLQNRIDALEAIDIPLFEPPYEILGPMQQAVPFILSSPHSGRHYPPEFLAASSLDLKTLRRSEDCFVDELFAEAAALGAPLLCALFPRAYLDPNREPYELDPGMFEDALPAYANTQSLRVAGGLGTLARVVTDGAEIYRQKMLFAEAENRIESLYLPYHRQLRDLIDTARERFGYAVLIDCHSMPSIGGPMDEDSGHDRADIVLGDRFGTSCSPGLTQLVEETLTQQGYSVARNNPYAGGYTTDHYGRPVKAVHTLQIEINRALYMDEELFERRSAITRIVRDMRHLMQKLASLEPSTFILGR
jgi:N-formylglutamate amidohydrolase